MSVARRRIIRIVALAFALTSGLIVFADEDQGDPFVTTGQHQDAYLQPAAGLDRQQLQAFQRGRKHFDKIWGAVTSLDFEWGLGPTFIAKSCAECHTRGGRGRPPTAPDEQLHSMLVRISLPGSDARGGPKPHPNYGDQLQNAGLNGPFPDFAYHTAPVPPEAALYLDWEELAVDYADGERVMLRRPKLRIEKLAYGPLGDEVMTSVRIAQPVHGLGLLEAVSEETLLAIARSQRAQGFNGRPNYVRDDVNDHVALGRFGWKANQPSIRQQIAAASLGDMGLTSRLYRAQNCPPIQRLCAIQTPGNDPELTITDWDELELWTRALAVPALRNVDDPIVRHGARLFNEAKCDVCHVPTLRTADKVGDFPQLASRTFHPYTDLLLHDMGEGLSDGRPDYRAGPRDWRTPPLWGMGLSEMVNGSGALLHDGRARNAEEAILWHGGEAEAAKEAFRNMAKADRAALLRFLAAI
ncbi:MAG TPA: di-heme oxidoredictase family protein [Burkholderiales bacterium]|nr:di-heme oxidoredictase family protein [Burkholderiales bacterium]